MFIWTGISLSFYTGLLSPIIIGELPKMSMSDEYSYSMLVTFCLGGGQMVGTFLMGLFIDKESISFLYKLTLVILITNLIHSFSYISLYISFKKHLSWIFMYNIKKYSFFIRIFSTFMCKNNSKIMTSLNERTNKQTTI